MSWEWMTAIVVVVAAAAVAILLIQRSRRSRQTRMISFVALLREPITFDPAVLASVAGRVWDADLGHGDTEGADGQVVGAEIAYVILHRGQKTLVNCFPMPYTKDPQATAERIPDLRVRPLLSEHQAWFSCDSLDVDGTTPEDEVRDWYRRLGNLFAELLDENCLLIYLPELDWAFPVNEDTEAALRSSDPVAALRNTRSLPVIPVDHDDPLMIEAVAKARQELPTFLAAFEARVGKNFSVKAPVTHGTRREFIWISVTSVEGERIYGELGNDPLDLGPLKLGSKVSVLAADLNDWCYLDMEGSPQGLFTVDAVKRAARRSQT